MTIFLVTDQREPLLLCSLRRLGPTPDEGAKAHEPTFALEDGLKAPSAQNPHFARAATSSVSLMKKLADATRRQASGTEKGVFSLQGAQAIVKLYFFFPMLLGTPESP